MAFYDYTDLKLWSYCLESFTHLSILIQQLRTEHDDEFKILSDPPITADVDDDQAIYYDELQPAMVRTHAAEDLAAVMAWVKGLPGPTDIELLIEDKFFLLSFVSLDLHVKMDFLDPFPVSETVHS
ncbi:hypothetical protein Tco_0838690 [Tanacetum coccineum]|uniref:Uncharacterized protein n=1 Tax=Tanacetum coccineum TaxID=301880 RepID=A0ABQ5ASJ5_9ASTR